MRKFCLFIAAVFLMTSVVCAGAMAAQDPAEGTVLRISGETEGGDLLFYEDHTSHTDGWEAAIDLAESSKEMKSLGFTRVVVDFYADWKAKDGVFGSGGDGFNWSTIHVPDDVEITVNLNGHTIDRGLGEAELDGEVIFIDEDTDVIINNGTVKGGWSDNGAGGIHIADGARVILNDVHVVENRVEDDDGGGIAVYNGANLTMNGGSVSDNGSYSDDFTVYGGGVYVEDSTAGFNGVTFRNNQGYLFPVQGAAIYVKNSTVVMDKCKVIGNGCQGTTKGNVGASTIVHILRGSKVTVTETDFIGNGFAQEAHISSNTTRYSSVIRNIAGTLVMKNCTFSDNNQAYLMDIEAGILTVEKTDFTGNNSLAFFGNCADISDNTFTECRFSHADPLGKKDSTFYFNTNPANLTFIDCDPGDATYNDTRRATFVDSDVATEYPVGSVIGKGSVTVVAVISVLLILAAVLGTVVVYRRNKTAAKP